MVLCDLRSSSGAEARLLPSSQRRMKIRCTKAKEEPKTHPQKTRMGHPVAVADLKIYMRKKRQDGGVKPPLQWTCGQGAHVLCPCDKRESSG